VAQGAQTPPLAEREPRQLQVRRGDPVWVELPPGECLALPAE